MLEICDLDFVVEPLGALGEISQPRRQVGKGRERATRHDLRVRGGVENGGAAARGAREKHPPGWPGWQGAERSHETCPPSPGRRRERVCRRATCRNERAL